MHTHDDDDLHDRGLAFDVATLLNRRRMLGLIGAAGLAALVGCEDSGDSPSRAASASATPSGSSPASCEEIPAETAGPFPGDGTNGPNVLAQSGIVRSDIRSSFGSGSGVAAGVPLTINLTVVDAAKGCAAMAGAAVYLWHCDNAGRYSLYTAGVTNENYLRGVQAADNAGSVTFRSVFPGAYAGRWPHVHFEVYPSLAAATGGDQLVATSQLALPPASCEAAYATDGYADSVANLRRTSLDSDGVFRDGYARQLATVTGSVSAGFVANLSVPV